MPYNSTKLIKCSIRTLVLLLTVCLLELKVSAQDTWTQKADFGAAERWSAVGFSIGTKGYIGTGFYNDVTPSYYKDFWEWDQATNTWTQKTDFGGTARSGAVGFSIGTKGYIGTGVDGVVGYTKDFWEGDQ